MPVLSEFSIRLRCRRPFGGECSHAAGCLTGPGAFPRRRGNDTLILSAASSGQGHVRADGGLPTPCRWGDSLHVSRPVSTVRAGGFSEREETQGRVVPEPNDNPPCPCGDMPSVDGPGSRPGGVASGCSAGAAAGTDGAGECCGCVPWSSCAHERTQARSTRSAPPTSQPSDCRIALARNGHEYHFRSANASGSLFEEWRTAMNRIACPGCGHGLKYSDEHAGKKAKCQNCGQLLQLPSMAMPLASVRGQQVDGAGFAAGQRFWLLLGRVPSGPLTVAEVHAKLANGEVTPQTLVCPLGDTN